ncbi:hypothetical protein ASD45_11560 [Pseudolabrys sp. Root1462]|uniref:MBL fold metallo-hydrolase n=1 Tax=Pseudolabrys sp. Root1462 TaxID=1736466 RepID=UPI0007025EE8|nr:MBL fold metallo-hydrolase [Pseudolabrys sp. Root1462]KQZ01416.1 hypothetical protein ASD45_11560 [Pseudolabrys sp. Root1462]
MHLTIIGCGDAFGSGGRYNTCFMLKTAKATLLVDCGASAMPALNAQTVDRNTIDGIVLSHLHGDHFGGLPFFILDAQFLSRREKPLLIAGPPGSKARIDAAMEVFFPKSNTMKWKFPWSVQEIPVGVPTDLLGHSIVTAEVIHQSGAPSTALRLTDGDKTFAYSGDTEWTDALLPVAKGADLFICECYGFEGKFSGHLSWDVLRPRIGDLGAKQTMVTHMNPTMLSRLDEVRAGGVLIAEDGLKMAF